MRFSTAAAALTSLLSVAQARIVGIAVPETIKPGSEIEATIITEGYIQSVYDVAVVFGASAGEGYPGTLGKVLAHFDLVEDSNSSKNLTKTVPVSEDVAAGKGVISASVFSLYGASSSGVLSNYNVSVTFGDETSKTLKASEREF